MIVTKPHLHGLLDEAAEACRNGGERWLLLVDVGSRAPGAGAGLCSGRYIS